MFDLIGFRDVWLIGRVVVKRAAMNNLLIVAVLVFLMSEGKALADPLFVTPGRVASMDFLESCIMNCSIPITVPDDTPCPPPFSCMRGWSGGEENHDVPFVLAGMVNIPDHELIAMDEAGVRIAGAMPLLVMGVVFILLSNFIRLCVRRREQQVSLHTRTGKYPAEGNAVTART